MKSGNHGFVMLASFFSVCLSSWKISDCHWSHKNPSFSWGLGNVCLFLKRERKYIIFLQINWKFKNAQFSHFFKIKFAMTSRHFLKSLDQLNFGLKLHQSRIDVASSVSILKIQLTFKLELEKESKIFFRKPLTFEYFH